MKRIVAILFAALFTIVFALGSSLSASAETGSMNAPKGVFATPIASFMQVHVGVGVVIGVRHHRRRRRHHVRAVIVAPVYIGDRDGHEHHDEGHRHEGHGRHLGWGHEKHHDEHHDDHH